MTLIVTLPAGAAPPTARAAALEPTADPAATCDPFASALAAALTAGLIMQPAAPTDVVALVLMSTPPTPAGTDAPSDALVDAATGTPGAASAAPAPPAGTGASRWLGGPWTAPTPSATSLDQRLPLARPIPTDTAPGTEPPAAGGAAWQPVAAASGRAQAQAHPTGGRVVTVSTSCAPALALAHAPSSPAVAGTIEPLQSSAQLTLDGVAAAWPMGGAVTIERVFRLSSATIPADRGTTAAAAGAGLGTEAVSDAAAQTTVTATTEGYTPFDAISSLIDRVVGRMRSSRAPDDQRSSRPGDGAGAASSRGAASSVGSDSSIGSAFHVASASSVAFASDAAVDTGSTDAPSAVPARRATARDAQTFAPARAPISWHPVAVPATDEGAATWAGSDAPDRDADARPMLRLIKFAPAHRGLKRTAWGDAPSTRTTDARRAAPPAGGTAMPAEEAATDPRTVEPANTPGPMLSALTPSPARGARSTVEPIAEPAAAPAATEAAPPPTPIAVTLRVGEGDGETTRVRVTMRGDTVLTRIVTPDAHAAAQLTAASADLRSGLAQHGLTDAGANILAAPPSPTGDRGAAAAAPPATDVVAGTTSSRGTDAPSDHHSSGNRKRGEEAATDRPGQQGSRSQQRPKRERER